MVSNSLMKLFHILSWFFTINSSFSFEWSRTIPYILSYLQFTYVRWNEERKKRKKITNEKQNIYNWLPGSKNHPWHDICSCLSNSVYRKSGTQSKKLMHWLSQYGTWVFSWKIVCNVTCSIGFVLHILWYYSKVPLLLFIFSLSLQGKVTICLEKNKGQKNALSLQLSRKLWI